MRKILFFTAFILLGYMGNAQGQAIKANPVGLAFGIANAGYEFSTNDNETLTIVGLYYNISDISGFGAGLEYRRYFSTDEALRGWHAGPSAGYYSLEDDFNNSGGLLIVGAEAGHQWIFGEHFVLDVFAGLNFVTARSDNRAIAVNNTSIGLGVSLGYAW